ncbi:MAG: T9SS type A sorting domain-containing protein [Lewinellaceae bacterium]|nr:T9SS type A sorting domain-containing protein [Lewinellaceae bacterium]
MRIPVLLAILFLISLDLMYAQQSWYKKIQAKSIFDTNCKLLKEDDHFLLISDGDIYQVDQSGQPTGRHKNITSNPYWTSVVKKYDNTTGHPYFIITERSVFQSSNKQFTIKAYRPGEGVVAQSSFADSLGSPSYRSLPMIETADNEYVYFGQDFFRKITYTPGIGFEEKWANPLQFRATAAIQHGNQFIVGNPSGSIIAIGDQGNKVWQSDLAMLIRQIKDAGDGIIVCGKNDDGQATAARIGYDGGLLWMLSYPDKEFYDIIPTSDGGFAATGTSAGSTIALVKLDAGGNLLCEKQYEQGSGTSLLQPDDDGFVVLGKRSGYFHLIKTDASGIAPASDTAFLENRVLRTNLVRAIFSPGAEIFDQTSVWPSVLFQDYQNVADFISCTPMFGGIDEDSSLHVAAASQSSYFQDYRSGLSFGPAIDFARVWSVSREEIARLRRDYGTDKTLDQPIPYDILTWPGKGNPYLQYNIDFTPVTTPADEFPAPFIDANNDGIYNVYDGDYPLMKGDEMAWWVLTDSTAHKESLGAPLLIDMAVSVYVYNCPQNQTLAHTVMAEWNVINRSPHTYQDAFMGFFSHPSIGCLSEEFFGTLVDDNAIYLYSNDTLGLNCLAPAFSDKMPILTISFPDQSLDRTMFFNIVSIGNPLVGTTGPEQPLEYYHYLKGLWRDGTPLTYGGSGYTPGSSDTVDHVFTGNPADPTSWNMCTASLPYADRRLIYSHGPFYFLPNDTLLVTLAFSLHENSLESCPDVGQKVAPVVQQITLWKNSHVLDPDLNLDEVLELPAGQSIVINPAAGPGASYLWSTGATSSSISITEAGTYAVTITLESGCELEKTVIVQNPPLSNFAAPDAGKVNIYPNPAGSYFQVDCESCPVGRNDIYLRDVYGNVVQTLHNHPNNIKIENMPAPGFYWLEIRNGDQLIATEKVVVLKSQ